MNLNSLAFRLLATSAAWMLVVLPLAGFIIYRLYSEDVRANFDDRLAKLVNSIALDALDTGSIEPVIPVNRFEPLFEDPHSGWYWQISPLGHAAQTLKSKSLESAGLESPFEAKMPADEAGQRWLNAKGPVGESIRIIEVIDAIGKDAGAKQYSVSVAGPIAWLETRNRNFLTRLTIALALTGIGLVLASLFQVRVGLMPLRSIEHALADIRSGKAEALDGELPEEIAPLQRELNALIKSNQDIVDRARTQVGNLAHALKTPLAVITNEANEERTPFGAKVAEQARLMRDQINTYLDRARMAARIGVIGRVTEVAPVVEALKRALERIHRDRGITITTSVAPGLKFQGEQQDLEELLGNLLDNGCKWATSEVSVSASPAPDRDRLRRMVVTVEDDGPGLSADERAKLGKRGLRLDETKPGSGLGLSIVTDLVTSYRGNFELAESPKGGLLARLELPAA
ncbi:MAG: ATP-binding protein [Hyphomicrobium sp.]|nr:ATP-binding protein [Hyphomicrobium sp.]